MSTNYNTCFIEPDGTDVSQEFVEKRYLLDVYPNLIDTTKASSLWVWGTGLCGRLGTNNIINQSSPVQTVSGGTDWKSIAMSSYVGAAIKNNGTLWMWGRQSENGVLGTNSLVNQSSPVQTISGGTNWKEISLGIEGPGRIHAAAIKTDGTLWMWGGGSCGALGNNTVAYQSSPVQTISGGTNWKQVSAGHCFSAAVKTDGTLWTWGNNSCGQLGTNSIISRSSPVQTISGGTNWKQVSVGGNIFNEFTAAIKTDGSLWLWGTGSLGRLGNNNSINQSSPVQTVSGGTDWKQVSGGVFHAAAIKTNGSLWLWGSPSFLGINCDLNQSSPVQTISGGTNWKQVSAGCRHTGAIKTDGTLWMWGALDGNSYGQLGLNCTVNIRYPTPLESTNWICVILPKGQGASSSMAIKKGD